MILLPLALLGGVAVGGGSAFVVERLLPPAEQAGAPVAGGDETLVFVPTGTVLAPMVLNDGGLAGYANFELQLQVPAEQQEDVAARIPLLLNAINLRTYRTPLAAGPEGQIPDLTRFRKLVQESANHALGQGLVRQVAITQARPE